MGIDFGSKKVGIALSDESGVMAFPHSVISNDAQLFKTVMALIEKERVGELVIGYSVDKAGVANPIHRAVESFMTDITLALPIPIHLEPEQYSTQQAIRIQGKNSHTDAAAAAIILDSYLMKQNKTSVFTELND